MEFSCKVADLPSENVFCLAMLQLRYVMTLHPHCLLFYSSSTLLRSDQEEQLNSVTVVPLFHFGGNKQLLLKRLDKHY